MEFKKLNKNERVRALYMTPVAVLALPVVIPYTFIREVFEHNQTIRGWFDELVCDYVELSQYFFLGGYYPKLVGNVSKREKIRKLRKTKVSKKVCQTFVKSFRSWIYPNKKKGKIYYDWSSDYADIYSEVVYKGKDRYTFSYNDNSYGSGRKNRLNSKYELTEEQVIAVLEAWAKY